jgi:hypothetical protein
MHDHGLVVGSGYCGLDGRIANEHTGDLIQLSNGSHI